MGEGTKEYLYTLSLKGIRLLADIFEEQKISFNFQEAKRIRQNALNMTIFDHFLEINDFRIALNLSVRQREDCKMLFWKYDNELRHKIKRGVLAGEQVKDPDDPSEVISVAPDAFFGMQTPRGTIYRFVEIDRGTMVNNVMYQKLKGYAQYAIDGTYTKRWGYQSFGVLVICPDLKSIQSRFSLINQIRYPQFRPFVWFTTRDKITPQSLFGNSWFRYGETALCSLF